MVPSHERENVLKEYHDVATAGHYGVERTLSHISQRYFWLGMGRQVAEHIKDCVDCQRYKATNLKPAGLLQTPVMKQRFEVLSIDLFGPLVTSGEGYRWVLLIEDTASRWVELFALRDATASQCATILLDMPTIRNTQEGNQR